MKIETAKRRKQAVAGMLFLILVFFCGCSGEQKNIRKVRDLDFTVVEDSQVPQELMQAMEEKKTEGFKLTYADKGELYLAIGYGEQQTSGYSISADECYLTQNAIYFKTTLIGPKKGEKVNEVSSFPRLVIKTEYMEKNVVFE